MLQRNNSNKKQQRRPLGRSKSTTSIHRNPVQDLRSIDPAIAQRDAQIAALLSYNRGDYMTGHPRNPANFIMERTSSRQAFERHGPLSNHSEFGLKRQQSIRFTGPQARSRNALEPRMSDTDTTSSFTYGRLCAAGKSDSRRNDSTFSETYTVLRDSHMQQHNPAYSNEYDMSENDGLSVHPSYRKLRKSKSMFTPSDFPVISHAHGGTANQPPVSRPPSRYAALNKENKPSPKSVSSAVRGPKSMSFLRNRRYNTPSQASMPADSEFTVPFTKHKIHDLTEHKPRISSRPSLFFRSKAKRSESTVVLRRSMRDSSNNTGLSSAFSGDSLYVPKHGSSLRSTARKVSKTFKNKIKGIFGRKSSGMESLSHEISPPETENDSICKVDIPEVREEASMSRGPSRLASIHAVPPCQQPRSREGSLEQVESDVAPADEDKSRVTSWTDSVTNTVASQSGTGEWERQHLSIIKENGMQIPVTQQQKISRGFSKSRPAVDAQRIYSALMKRADETHAQEPEGRHLSLDQLRASGKPPSRTSSVDQVSKQWSPPTIRCVQADDDVFQDPSGEIQNDNSEAVSSAQHADVSDHSGSARVVSIGKSSTSSKHDSDRVKPMSNRNSVFFASPSNHLFRTTSPFRRVLQENMRASQEHTRAQSPETEPTYMGSLSAITLPSRRPSTAASERDDRLTYAESTYSCTTDDGKYGFGRNTQSLVERFPEPPKSHVRETTAIEESPDEKDDWIEQQRQVSSASSVDWKKFLSANVSKQEGRGTLRRAVGKIPSMSSHIREETEIESPPDDLQTSDYRKTPNRNVNPQKSPNYPRPYSSHQETSVSASGQGIQEGFPFPRDFPALCPQYVPWKKDLRPAPSLPYIKAGEAKGEMWGYGEAVPLSASMGTVNSPDTSKRDELVRKRRARGRIAGQIPSAKSSPGLTAAVEKQFGKLASNGQQMNWNKIETSPSPSTIWARPSLRETATPENMLSRPDPGVGSLGSKQMVDTFLNSRKRGIVGSRLSTEGDSESSPAAFL